MTHDKATYTITFKDDVPTTMPSRLKECANSDTLTVEIDGISGNVLQLSVFGEHAIPLFEERMRKQELSKYPSAEIDCDVEIGAPLP